MALSDGAELVVLAPAVREFGEDKTIDGLIRKYGYHGTPATLMVLSTGSLWPNSRSARHSSSSPWPGLSRSA